MYVRLPTHRRCQQRPKVNKQPTANKQNSQQQKQNKKLKKNMRNEKNQKLIGKRTKTQKWRASRFA